ncbi:hypothetical protein HGRIS_007700 [Hohenbuehelia grisea]|uniref:G-protein coupled receptors family 1 profile domain-containing protein n=1 Tax=Hohenbuehelia grisea TaxID=104357 RepID=A0ABR3J614_9AGAR
MSRTPDAGFIHAFVALQGSAAIALCILLVTASVSRRITRDATWYNFCISWIISCLSYLLLSLAGQQFSSTPIHAVCLTQASLIYAAPPLTACTTLALVIQLWSNVQSISLVPTSPQSKKRGLMSWILLLVPYAVFLVVFIGGLLVGIQHPDSVIMSPTSGMYCGISIKLPGWVSAILVATFMLATIVLEFLVVVTFYRNWRALRDLDARVKNSLTLAIRIATFTLFSLMSVVVAPVYLAAVMAPVPNIIISLTPLTAVLVFGTQTDLLYVWMFWRKPPSEADVPEDFAAILQRDSVIIV